MSPKCRIIGLKKRSSEGILETATSGRGKLSMPAEGGLVALVTDYQRLIPDERSLRLLLATAERDLGTENVPEISAARRRPRTNKGKTGENFLPKYRNSQFAHFWTQF